MPEAPIEFDGIVYDGNPITARDVDPTDSSTSTDEIPLIRGCTSQLSVNFNPEATIDDGSCSDIEIETPDDYISLVGFDEDIQIAIKSVPKDCKIFVDGIDIGKITPNTLTYTQKQLLTPKVFKLQLAGYTSETQYRVKVINANFIFWKGINYRIILEKLVDGVWQIQPRILSDGIDIKYVELDFDMKLDIIPDVDVNPQPTDPIAELAKHKVQIIGDVSSNDIIKYITSQGKEGFVQDGDLTEFTILSNSDDTETPWIEFQRVGINNYTHTVQYEYADVDGQMPITLEDDFRKILGVGTTTIKVTANKLAFTPSPDAPTVRVDNDVLQYNVNTKGYVNIKYFSQNTDIVKFSLGNTQRNLKPNGTIQLSASDFTNGLGNYTVYLQPTSTRGGSGEIQRVLIQVVSKEFIPGPDITHITYPENIQGADFRGYNEDFKIAWQSVNTNYIEIYVKKYDQEFAVAKVENSGTLTLNVSKLLTKAKIKFGNNTDKIPFDLILIPFNQEGNELTAGKHEKITINFDKGDLRLRRAQVISDLKIAFETQLKTETLQEETSRYLTHYIHLGDAENKLISTWAIDTETFSEYSEDPGTSKLTKVTENKTLVLKLYEPLPNGIQPNTVLWMSKLQSIPIVNQIVINDEEVSECIILTPNFQLDMGDDIGYQILDDLVASGSVSSTELAESFIGTNEFSLNSLNLSYLNESDYLWDNFVKYSSAEERVENFYYKVGAIQSYEGILLNLASGSSSTGSIEKANEIKRTNETITNLKKGFDSFEKILYTESGSLTFPGAGGNELSSSTSGEAESWYTGIIDSAKDFDEFNDNSLVNNIPLHIKNDDQGQDFVLFFNMIGQHFDVLTSYTQGIIDGKKITHNNNDGLTNELIYHMLESLGWDADMGVKSQYLWEYAFGKSIDGSVVSEMSGKDRQQEIWRRLINNLPYLYKHKGTKRALHAAMACYGVPSSMLTIMEFGGPVDTTGDGTTSFTFDDRTAALSFTGVETLTIPWKAYNSGSITTPVEYKYPNTIEFRIHTEERVEQTLLTAEGFSIKLIPGTGSQASVQLWMDDGGVADTYKIKSTYFPMYNDEYTQIAVTRTLSGSSYVYEVFGKEGYNERIRNEGYASLTIPTGNGDWHYGTELTFGTSFIGEIDEFRLWSYPLEESRIENHTLLPDAIDGNHVSASSEDLIFRNDFEYPKDRSSGGDVDIKNVSINLGYEATSSVANNFTSITDYPYQYVPYERTVTAVVPATGVGFANKIRFEQQTFEDYLKFGAHSNVTSKDNEKDSNRLGLFFSPIKEVNMDIVKSLGQFNIDNYIGNPADEYNDGYHDLDELREYYFQRFNLNIYEYIQLVRYIDQTIFTTLESLVPGRAKVSSGLLIEPHLLERSKIKRTKPVADKLDYAVTIDTEETTNISAEQFNYLAEIDANEDVDLEAEISNFDGTIDASSFAELTATKDNYFGTIDTEEDINLFGTFPTYEATIDAKITGSVSAMYDSIQYTEVGLDPTSTARAGFGIYGTNGHVIRTFMDVWGNMLKNRQQIYRLKQSYTEDVPENINYSDSSLGVHYVTQTKYKYSVTTLPYGATIPTVGGDIVAVEPIDGYFKSHYRNVGDLSSGMQNSWYNGSKQTSATTLDGGSAVETWTTNPNTLKVNDSGRGSGEPILEVD